MEIENLVDLTKFLMSLTQNGLILAKLLRVRLKMVRKLLSKIRTSALFVIGLSKFKRRVKWGLA